MYLQFVGIDVSKDSFDVAVISKDNKLIFQDKFEMSKSGIDSFIDSLNGLFETILFAMEATSIYHLPLLHYLLEKGLKCVVVNPLLIKNSIGATTLRKTKSDKKDALHIATFISKEFNSFDPINELDVQTSKALVREREAISKEIATIKTKIKAIVTLLFPELLKNTNIFTKSILNLLLQAPSRKAIRNLKQQKIDKILKEHSDNKAKIGAKDILELAKNSIAINDKSLEKVLQSKIKHLLFLQGELKSIDDELHRVVNDENPKLKGMADILKSIPGIGTITAINFIAEIICIERFPSVKQLIAFIGFDPSLKQSGSSILYHGSISKRGNAILRRTLWQMANGVIRSCDKFRQYYDKKHSEGKTYKQAVVAVANKLLRTIFVLLKNGAKFDANLAN